MSLSMIKDMTSLSWPIFFSLRFVHLNICAGMLLPDVLKPDPACTLLWGKPVFVHVCVSGVDI